MNLIVRRCLNRSRFVEELVETWQTEHKNAMFAKDIEELTEECLDLGNLMRDAWKSVKDELITSGAISDEHNGRMWQLAVKKSDGVMKKVLELVSKAEEMGFEVEGSAQLSETADRTEAIKEEIEATWPARDVAMVEASLKAYKNGEYRDIEDVLNEAQGPASGPNQP